MDVPELIPLDEYDPNQAKLEASVSWLCTKAFGNDVPEQLDEPFYYNSQDSLSLKPALITGLTSAQIYCQACVNLFSLQQQPRGHAGVIEALCKRGVYVLDVNESAVSEKSLASTQPFYTSSHLALIDALMVAYTSDVITIERVVQAVRKFASFNASSELPFDTEDAILFWLNKCCGVVRQRLERLYQSNLDGNGSNRLPPRSVPFLPHMHDLLKDVYDGCCLATAISFYCPTALRQHEIVMEESIRTADAMFNIQLILEFCCESLPLKTAHLSLNDLFYTNPVLKPNLLVFIAELFYYFEIDRVHCVRPPQQQIVDQSSVPLTSHAGLSQAGPDDGDVAFVKKVSSPASVPHISHATKRSFTQSDSHRTNADSADHYTTPQLPAARQPLLSKRQQQQQQQQQVVESFSSNPHLTSTTGTDILSGVSIDDSEQSFDLTVATDTSMTISELPDTARSSLTTPPPTDVTQRAPAAADMSQAPARGTNLKSSHSLREVYKKRDDVFPFGNRQTGAQKGVDEPERLQPAVTRPAKEKVNTQQSKRLESGEQTTPSSRLQQQQRQRDVIAPEDAIDVASDSEPSDSEYQTPSSESAPFFSCVADDNMRKNTSDGHGDATARSSASATGQSFVLDDVAYDEASARAAGIPVVTSRDNFQSSNSRAKSSASPSGGTSQRKQWNRPQVGAFETSPRNSSDGSDQELRKIHADHLESETKSQQQQAFYVNSNGETVHRPDSLSIHSPNSTKLAASTRSSTSSNAGSKTSFAQLQRRQSNDNMVSSDGQRNQHQSAPLSLKEQYDRSKTGSVQSQTAPTGGKKTTFAALPNQTTWSEFVMKSSTGSSGSAKSTPETGSELTEGDAQTPQAEMLNIRMLLGESRRKIEGEKRKTEVQMTKQRQRVGKQAFMQVISRNKDDNKPFADNVIPEETVSTEPANNSQSQPTSAAHDNKHVRQSDNNRQVRTSSADRLQGNSMRVREPSPEVNSAQVQQKSRSRVQRSRSSVERMTPPRMTPPTGGERKSPSVHDRRPSAQEERLQQLMQRLDSIETSPRLAAADTSQRHNAAAHSQQQQQQRKQFSRENIQNTIDNAKRWVGSDHADMTSSSSSPPVEYRQRRSGQALGRPQSFHVADRPVAQFGRARLGSEERQMTSASQQHQEPRPGEYSASLEKLNTSLSELQGEIMSMSLSNNDAAAAASTGGGKAAQQKGVAPRMTQSDDILAQGIRDNFFLIPREGEATGSAGGQRRMTPSRMTQSGPDSNRASNARTHAQYDGYQQPQQQRYAQTPQRQMQQQRRGVSPSTTSSPHNYASPQRYESPPPPSSSQSHFSDVIAPYSLPANTTQFASPQYMNAGQAPPPPPSHMHQQPMQNYGVMPPTQNTQLYAAEPDMANYGSMPVQQQQQQPPPHAYHTMHHPAAPVNAPPHMPPSQWGVPMAPLPSAPSPVQYAAGGATTLHNNVNIPQQQLLQQAQQNVMTSRVSQYDRNVVHTPPPATPPYAPAAAAPSQPDTQYSPHVHEPRYHENNDQFTFDNNYPIMGDNAPPMRDNQSAERQLYSSTSSERLPPQQQLRQQSPSIVEQFAMSEATTIDNNTGAAAQQLMTSSITSPVSSPAAASTATTGVRSPASHVMNSGAGTASRSAGGGGGGGSAPHSPRTPSRTNQPPVTNDGFFIAFDNDTPVKPRPKLGQRPRVNSGSAPAHASAAKLAANSKAASKKSATSTTPKPVSALTQPARDVNDSDTGSADADVGDASPREAVAYEVTIPGEAFVIATGDEDENAELDDVERRRQKFLALQSRRKEDEEQKRKKLEDNKRRLNEKQSQKQAHVEQKKAEEKARREQIFQEYLKRKAERERLEQDARSGTAPVSRRNKLSRSRGAAGAVAAGASQRPKSQPVFMHDVFSAHSSSHSSQEDLRAAAGVMAAGRGPAHERHASDRLPERLHGGAYQGAPVHPDRAALFGASHLAPAPHMDMHDGDPRDYSRTPPPPSHHHHYQQQQSPQYVAGGGVTHRRPPTPEAMTRSYGDQTNNNTDYSGPKLFKKPSSKSNKHLIVQAISSCCLAGAVNNDVKHRVLEILHQCDASQYVILFRDAGQQFRAIYTYNLDTEDIFKMYGVGPKQITGKMLERFYKYNSGSKKFSEVTTTKHMSATIDAVTLFNSYWKKKVEKKAPMGYC